MPSFSIGDTVKTNKGEVGKLIGVVAGIAYIGLPEKSVITCRANLLRKHIDPGPERETIVIEEKDVGRIEDVLEELVVEEDTQSLTPGAATAPAALTKEWLSSTPVETLQSILKTDATLSSPRKSKIRRAIRKRSNGSSEGC